MEVSVSEFAVPRLGKRCRTYFVYSADGNGSGNGSGNGNGNGSGRDNGGYG